MVLFLDKAFLLHVLKTVMTYVHVKMSPHYFPKIKCVLKY